MFKPTLATVNGKTQHFPSPIETIQQTAQLKDTPAEWGSRLCAVKSWARRKQLKQNKNSERKGVGDKGRATGLQAREAPPQHRLNELSIKAASAISDFYCTQDFWR